MRSLKTLSLAVLLVISVAIPASAAGLEGQVEREGRTLSASVSRDGSPGRSRPGSSRWAGCFFFSPLSETEAEAKVSGRAPISDIARYFASPDPDAEFIVWICPYGKDGVYREFGGWEVTERPPVDTAERLADFAIESVWIPELIPQTSPDGTIDTPTIVNLETWFWVDEWTNQSATVWLDAFPADWLTVTLVPTNVIYKPGDGSETDVSCAPGTEWASGVTADCVYVYELLSEDDFYTVQAFVYYEVNVTCPANWCDAARIEGRLNAQVQADPFDSERDVYVDQVRGLVTG